MYNSPLFMQNSGNFMMRQGVPGHLPMNPQGQNVSQMAASIGGVPMGRSMPQFNMPMNPQGMAPQPSFVDQFAGRGQPQGLGQLGSALMQRGWNPMARTR